MRLRPALLLVPLLLAFVPGARAEDPTVEQVKKAFANGESSRLAEIAAPPEVDHWAVVDELLAAGNGDAAKAFASAYEGADADALQRFAAETPPKEPVLRDGFAAAEAAYHGGDWENALAVLRDAEPPVGPVLAMRVAVLEGRLLAELGRFDEAREPYARAAGRAVHVGRNLIAEVDALSTRLFSVLEEEDFPRLSRIAERSVDVGQMLQDEDLGVHLANLGNIYFHLALPHRALRYLDRALHELTILSRDAPAEDLRAWAREVRPTVEIMRADVYSALGRHADALAVGEATLDWHVAREDGAQVAETKGRLADFHAAYGGFQEALRLNREAQQDLRGEDEETRLERLRLRVNEGKALQESGSLPEALEVLDDVIPTLETLASGRGLAVALLNLGEIHEKQGAWGEARACYAKALAIEGLDAWLTAFARVRRADAEARRGSATDPHALARAEAGYVAAAKALPAEADPGLHLLIRLGRGDVALARGRTEEALQHVRAAIDLLEGLTGGLADGEALQARSQADRQRLFDLAALVAVAAGDVEAEFEMSERSRARAFLAALGGRDAVREALLSPQARRRLQAAAERLTAAYAGQREAFGSGKRSRMRAAQTALRDAQIAHDRTVRRLERESMRLVRVARPALPDLARVQATLGATDALVLYTLLEPTSRALVVRKDSVRGVDLPSRTAFVDQCAKLAVEAKDAVGEVQGRLRALGRVLIDKLALPATTTRLLVSPDGVLAHVPWSLLPAPREGEPLEVVLVPSAATWLLLHGRVDGTGVRTLALGDPVYGEVVDESVLRVYAGGRVLPPLPGSRKEVLAITTDEDVRLLDRGATEAVLARELKERKRWRVVHLATHCVLDEDDPSLSALALTPASPDDGFLTALEVSTLTVPADLAVLSGCETGRDRSVKGEGLSGLTRAFLLSGASRVLVSQWPVDDEATRHFMTNFHREWAKDDVSAPVALRRARLATMKTWPHPRDWGAWVLWGRTD